MAANTTPPFVGTIHDEWLQQDGNGGAAGPLKTQNLAFDGTGTVLTIFTAGASGSIITLVTMVAVGVNAASVARFFVNNGSTNATIGNNSLIGEFTLNATAALTTAANPPYVWVPPGGILRLNPLYKLNVTLGATVAAGYVCTAFGGDW